MIKFTLSCIKAWVKVGIHVAGNLNKVGPVATIAVTTLFTTPGEKSQYPVNFLFFPNQQTLLFIDYSKGVYLGFFRHRSSLLGSIFAYQTCGLR